MARGQRVIEWIRNASEVSAGILIAGFGCVLAAGVLIKFFGLRTSPYFRLLPTEYCIPLLATVVGYTLGRASRDATPEELCSFKESLNKILGVARRDLITGSSFYLRKMREIKNEADEANFRRAVAAETLLKTYRDLGKAEEQTREGREIREQIRSLLQLRELRAWLDEESGNGVEGRRYRLTLRYDLPGAEEANSTGASEPSRAKDARIQVDVSSHDLRLKPRAVQLKLSRTGSSESRSISAEPLHDGICEISFVVSLLPRLELLQTYTARFEVAFGYGLATIPEAREDGGA